MIGTNELKNEKILQPLSKFDLLRIFHLLIILLHFTQIIILNT